MMSIASATPVMKRKLLARQLMWLAAADIVVACCSMYWVLSNGGYILFAEDTGQTITKIMQAIWGFSEFSSILMELHLALGVAFSWQRSLSSLRVLDRTLALVPLTATVCTILLVLFEPLHYYRHGQQSVVRARTMVVELVLLTLTFLSCFFAYASAVCAASRGTFAGGQGVQTRLWMYPANFVISYTLQYATAVNGELFSNWVGCFAYVCLAISGFLNAFTYFVNHRWVTGNFWVSRGSAASCSQNARLADIVSFHALFTDTLSVIELQTPTASEASTWSIRTFESA
eukprot:CAMPEP_0194485860 /NCGR_PEP_ID=MMETSP0253-20130528/6716_1 /TAXON_ID=2966 /ORGANISM="Noctiluca scintillans" /LENGTH=287 /DNA_ID=CAMNT_0039325881 /DNA_START=90 /DNA_END=953 /DNA_ORIENTATION=-